MKLFMQKTLIVMLAVIITSLFVKGIIQVGDTIIYENDIQVLYDLDYPQQQLNNHSLREVFEQGNKYIKSTYYDGANGSIILQDSSLVIWQKGDTNLNYWYIIDNTPNMVNSKYYINLKVENYFNDYKWRFDTGAVLPLINNKQAVLGIQRISGIETTNINDYGIYPQFSPIGQRSAKYYKDETIIVDMNNLGISSLTVSQMDYWFNIYQTLKALEV